MHARQSSYIFFKLYKPRPVFLITVACGSHQELASFARRLHQKEYFVRFIFFTLTLSFIKHSWSNGRIIAFQAIGPGSTPGGCTTSFSRLRVVKIHFFVFGVVVESRPGSFFWRRGRRRDQANTTSLFIGGVSDVIYQEEEEYSNTVCVLAAQRLCYLFEFFWVCDTLCNLKKSLHGEESAVSYSCLQITLVAGWDELLLCCMLFRAHEYILQTIAQTKHCVAQSNTRYHIYIAIVVTQITSACRLQRTS